MKLDALAGNAALKAQLSAQADGRGLGHAYLISGPVGSGKRTLARLMAAAMVCAAPGEKPCGRCPGCRKCLERIHPDVTEVDIPQGKREIVVDQARQIQSDAWIRPNEAPRKVYIIHRAETMNSHAQNALLKLLEDGPAYAAFLLLTLNPGSILTTIRSRCESLALSPLTPGQAEDYLRARFPQAPPEAVYTAARRCGGALGSAIAQLEGREEEDAAVRADAARLVELTALGDELALCQWCVGLERSDRESLERLLSHAVVLLRDALAGAAGAEPLTDGSGERGPVRAAAQLPPAQLLRCIELLQKLMADLALNVSPGHLCGALAAGLMEVRQ